MRFGVREDGVCFGNTRAKCSEHFARAVPLVLHHGDYRDVEPPLGDDGFPRLLLRPPPVHHNGMWKRPFRMIQSPRQDFLERRDIIIYFSHFFRRRLW